MTSTQVREKLVETIQLDLVGPRNDHAFAHELLPQSPQRWYLTGYLVHQKTSVAQMTMKRWMKRRLAAQAMIMMLQSSRLRRAIYHHPWE
jgi:hypothetical protein